MRTIAFGILLLAQAIGAQQQLETRGQSIAWHYDVRGEPGVVVGQLFSRWTGAPVEAAVVSFDLGAAVGVITDSEGRFRLEGARIGEENRLYFSLIGHRPDSLIFFQPSDASVQILGLLQGTQIGGVCGDLVDRGDRVMATVRDAQTGLPPEVPVTMTVRSSMGEWTTGPQDIRKRPNEGTRFLSIYRVFVPGAYEIEVSAPGFATWTVQVELETETAVCSPTAKNRSFAVSLQAGGEV